MSSSVFLKKIKDYCNRIKLFLKINFLLFFIQDFSKAMSQAGSSQFQEVIRQELEYSMKVELDKILATAHSNEIEVRSME